MQNQTLPQDLPNADIEPHVMSTYARIPLIASHGEGCWLWDIFGNKYLDALGGIAVNTLGHAHPQLVSALQAQVALLIHTSNYYYNPLQEKLANKLCELSGMQQVFFCNSGLEANEAAIKIARKYGHQKGIESPKIVVFEKAFHGRSIATLSATANPKVQQGFGPLLEGFLRIPLNDPTALQQISQQHTDIVAVFVEVIQGEGGVNPCTVNFLQELRKQCDQHEWLLMLDEVQCGIGRTGRWFAHQWADIIPDVMPLAKGLGSGVPIGAVVCGTKAAGVFKPGNHGTTFGGNALAMRAGIETLRIIEQEQLLENAKHVGQTLFEGFRAHLKDCPHVQEIRGQGLMLGIALDRPCTDLVKHAAQANLLISVTADNVIRLLPPLILTLEEAKQVIAILVPLIKQFLQQPLNSP